MFAKCTVSLGPKGKSGNRFLKSLPALAKVFTSLSQQVSQLLDTVTVIANLPILQEK